MQSMNSTSNFNKNNSVSARWSNVFHQFLIYCLRSFCPDPEVCVVCFLCACFWMSSFRCLLFCLCVSVFCFCFLSSFFFSQTVVETEPWRTRFTLADTIQKSFLTRTRWARSWERETLQWSMKSCPKSTRWEGGREGDAFETSPRRLKNRPEKQTKKKKKKRKRKKKKLCAHSCFRKRMLPSWLTRRPLTTTSTWPCSETRLTSCVASSIPTSCVCLRLLKTTSISTWSWKWFAEESCSTWSPKSKSTVNKTLQKRLDRLSRPSNTCRRTRLCIVIWFGTFFFLFVLVFFFIIFPFFFLAEVCAFWWRKRVHFLTVSLFFVSSRVLKTGCFFFFRCSTKIIYSLKIFCFSALLQMPTWKVILCLIVLCRFKVFPFQLLISVLLLKFLLVSCCLTQSARQTISLQRFYCVSNKSRKVQPKKEMQDDFNWGFFFFFLQAMALKWTCGLQVSFSTFCCVDFLRSLPTMMKSFTIPLLMAITSEQKHRSFLFM